MTDKLVRCQTGFVPNTGISVNQFRVVDRIILRAKNKQCKKTCIRIIHRSTIPALITQSYTPNSMRNF